MGNTGGQVKDLHGRELLFMSAWKEAWKELVDYLKVQQYHDQAMVDHLDEVLNGTKK
jgi:hypothetical protein